MIDSDGAGSECAGSKFNPSRGSLTMHRELLFSIRILGWRIVLTPNPANKSSLLMSPVRILFADDDRLVLATLANGLRKAGYAVDTAESGAAALALAAKAPFDLALLDIRMPGLSGIETARRLREESNLPVLFLSAYGEREQVEQAVAEGALAYVIKPVDIPQLVPAIVAALARARDLKALMEVRAQLEQALAGGRYTSMAIGILMERRRLGEQAAFKALRTNARMNQRKLEDYCRELVESLERLNSP